MSRPDREEAGEESEIEDSELERPSVAGPVFARVFGPQTGVQKNHFFRSLEGAKKFGKPVRVENCWGESVWPV